MRTLWPDIRGAFRTLGAHPGYTAIVALVLALGLGASTTVFSVANSILLRPLPYKAAERLVMVWGSDFETGTTRRTLTFCEYRSLEELNDAFEHLACYAYWPGSITGGDHPESVFAVYATASLFPTLGRSPVCGRTFTPEEDRPGAPPVIVLSHRLWERSFAADPAVIGQSVQFTGKPFTAIGVMPPDFEFPPTMTVTGRTMWRVDAWIPMASAAEDYNFSQSLFGIGTLKKGVSPRQAQALMSPATARLEATGRSRPVRLTPLLEQVVGDTRSTLIALLTVVGFVLLIVCASVANLVLSRFASRGRELALRSTLGASRMQLFRQLMMECIVLSLLGGVGGSVVSMWAVRAVIIFGPRNIPRLAEVRMDGTCLGFLLVLCIASGAVFGLFPALRACRVNACKKLGATARSRASDHFRSTIVVAELALALFLATSAGLMIRSFWNLQHIYPGFETKNRLTSWIQLPADGHWPDDKVRDFFSCLLDHVGSLVGVECAGAVSMLPMSDMSVSAHFMIDRLPTSGKKPAEFVSISPGYFNAMGIKLLKGRYFNKKDNEQAPSVVIISESLAQQYWPNKNPIGERLSCASFAGFVRGDGQKPWMSREIVGVVSNVRHFGLKQPVSGLVYLPHSQDPWPWMTVIVKTNHNPRSLLGRIQREVFALDMTIPVSSARTMAKILSEETDADRFLTLLLGTFAFLAIAIVSLGVYGVVSYSTVVRTQEIGIRIALGARPIDVLKTTVRQGLKLTLTGLAIGLTGALIATQVIANLLYDVSPTDPLILVCASLLLGGVALSASYIPARQAARINPLAALRCE